ncbi:TIGR01841 family phasin [Duganella sp. FT80W]|uniref:TIGR01841 family phasin n=1 Tax=Duganella guangzhouensis TaxID=2666084 RepID=A0A6I2L6V2_9BURK|nr:phasin family protein [Duganella guangzhouensis]MRW92947.1 TIGR01841 family phasin [Duganella guangzhouensis]
MFPQFPPSAFHSHIELLLGLYVDLGQRTLETMHSLSALNLQLGRDLIAEAGGNIQRLMASKDANQLGAAVAAQLRPGQRAFSHYQQRVGEVLSRANASLNQTAAHHMPAVSRSASTLTDDLMQEAATRTTRAAEQLARFQPGSQLRH